MSPPHRNYPLRDQDTKAIRLSDHTKFVISGSLMAAAVALVFGLGAWVERINSEGPKIDAIAAKVDAHGDILQKIETEVEIIRVTVGAPAPASTALPDSRRRTAANP